MKRKNFYGYLLAFLLTLLAIEILSLLFIRSGFLPAKIPSYTLKYSSVWLADIDPDFGVWHPSTITYRQKSACYDVVKSTNSYGAVDRERSLRSSESRVVVLGDSFVEGFGVDERFRMTNLLEEKTGLEHLNFGSSGNFGPTQYRLLYENLASRFDHDEVLVVLLPDNDFLDEQERPGRYHPYLEGSYPDYKLSYSLDSLEESYAYVSLPVKKSWGEVVREFSYTANMLSYMMAFQQTTKPETNEEGNYSGYYDYTEEDFLKLQYNLEEIRSLSEGKRMTVISIPRVTDLTRFSKEGSSKLNTELRKLAREAGFEYIDLLPMLHAWSGDDVSKFYLECDPHWSAEGHKAGAEAFMILRNR